MVMKCSVWDECKNTAMVCPIRNTAWLYEGMKYCLMPPHGWTSNVLSEEASVEHGLHAALGVVSETPVQIHTQTGGLGWHRSGGKEASWSGGKFSTRQW